MAINNHIRSAVVCNKVYFIYKDLLNCYIADYYLEKHWQLKLSRSWILFFEMLDFNEIGDVLSCNRLKNIVPPLSILCLQEIQKHFAIKRDQIKKRIAYIFDKNNMKLFWKNVKLKKQHEIDIMSEMCYQVASKTNCFNIVDVGSGLGHLSRILAYGYGFNVCTIEANHQLSQLASLHDRQLKKKLLLKKVPHQHNKIVHINHRIEEHITTEEFLSLVRQAFEINCENFRFGIVGLHPCGNLGSTLLKLYTSCPNIVFINIVSCCYMKLTLDSPQFIGFPLSDFYITNNYTLDYLSCESACHAIETYVKKLNNQDHIYFKIHAFRAALEHILVSTDYKLKHCAVSSVKYNENMSLADYCNKAIKKLNVKLSNIDIQHFTSVVNETWENVVKFYSIRLFLAPIVESIIVYDRLIYLEESNSICDILPVFDSQISPRNTVVSAQKHL